MRRRSIQVGDLVRIIDPRPIYRVGYPKCVDDYLEEVEFVRLQRPDRSPKLVLGMPSTAESGGHIRYHASKANISIYSSLVGACEAAAKLTGYYGDREVR